MFIHSSVTTFEPAIDDDKRLCSPKYSQVTVTCRRNTLNVGGNDKTNANE